jgi:hypothetical protein
MVMRTLPAVLAAAAVACLLLAGAGVYHARSASRLLAGDSYYGTASVLRDDYARAHRRANPSCPALFARLCV